jgi:hypothetical protein
MQNVLNTCRAKLPAHMSAPRMMGMCPCAHKVLFEMEINEEVKLGWNSDDANVLGTKNTDE